MLQWFSFKYLIQTREAKDSMKYAFLWAGLFFVLGCGNTRTKLDPPLSLQLAVAESAAHPLTTALSDFGMIAAEKTGKTLLVTVVPGKKFGEDWIVTEKCRKGEIGMACVSAASLFLSTEAFGVFSLPLIFRDEAHFRSVIEGPIGLSLLASMGKEGFIGLAFFDPGALHLYSATRELESAADLKNQRIAVPQLPLLRRFFEYIGARPSAMPEDQIYSALEHSVIDCAACSIAVCYEASHFMRAKYFTRLPHTRVPAVLLVSKAVWDKFPENLKTLLPEIARDASRRSRDALAAYETAALAKMAEKGVQVFESRDAGGFLTAADAFFAGQSGEMKTLIDRIRAN